MSTIAMLRQLIAEIDTSKLTKVVLMEVRARMGSPSPLILREHQTSPQIRRV
jgi:hypothetical protein